LLFVDVHMFSFWLMVLLYSFLKGSGEFSRQFSKCHATRAWLFVSHKSAPNTLSYP
jgi:cytochrome b561